jgi:hypothetical protein
MTGALIEAGELAAAETVCVAALARCQDVGDLDNQPILLASMADLDLRAGRIQDAAAHLREGLQAAVRTGDWFDLQRELATNSLSGKLGADHVAARLDITERSAHAIITDLTAAGYPFKQKDGRRNRYQIQAHLPLPEPASRERTVGEVLALLTGNDRPGTELPPASGAGGRRATQAERKTPLMPGRQADGAGSAVPDPRAESPTPHEPVTRLAEQARRVVAFHAPPATAFLMRLPGTTSTGLGRPAQIELICAP